MENIDPYISTASDELKDSLRSLNSNPCIHVVLVSGRDHFYHVKAIPEGLGVHRIANHGADFLQAGNTEWQTLVEQISLEWKALVEEKMKYFTLQCPGSRVE